MHGKNEIIKMTHSENAHGCHTLVIVFVRNNNNIIHIVQALWTMDGQRPETEREKECWSK